MVYQSVSIQQMKEALATVAGSKFPVILSVISGESASRYIRGFADAHNNVLLVSENSYSLALKIIEVKDIVTLQYAPEHGTGNVRAFRAKWASKQPKV